MEGFVEQLKERTSKFKETLSKKNSEGLINYNENLAKELWDRYVKIGLTQENLFEVWFKISSSFFLYFHLSKSVDVIFFIEHQGIWRSAESIWTRLRKINDGISKSTKIITSYNAIDYMTQLGRMDAELTNKIPKK